MNTIKKPAAKFSALQAITVLLLVLTACSKDETIQPASKITDTASSTSYTGTRNAPYSNSKQFEMIKINHLAGRSLMPDYEVTVSSDQTAVFTGRRNTAFTGSKRFSIDMETFISLKNLFERSQLFNISPAAGNANNAPNADIPMVITTYNNNGTDPETLTDNNDPAQKSNLYNVRSKAEEMLNISFLIYGWQ